MPVLATSLRRRPSLIEKVGQRARHVFLIGKTVLDRGKHILTGNGACQCLGQGAERGKLPLADHAHRIFHHHAQHADDPSIGIRKRTVGKGVVSLLGIPAALKDQQKRLIPRGLARLHHLPDARADVLPDLVPHLLPRACPEPMGAFFPRVVRR